MNYLIQMKKFYFILLVVTLINISCESSISPNATDSEIVSWSTKCVTDFLEDKLTAGQSLKMKEWILIEKKVPILVEVWQEDDSYKSDSITGCYKLLDSRNVFDEHIFIGKGDEAFVAIALAYEVIDKSGICNYFEKTYTLNTTGQIIDVYDYVTPLEIKKQTEQMFIKAVKEAMSSMGKDINEMNITIEGKSIDEISNN